MANHMSSDSLNFDPNIITANQAHFIDGKWHQQQGVVEVFRPSDNIAYASMADAGEEIVDLAVRIAEKRVVESGWRTRAPRERARAMRKWADLVEEHVVELAQLESLGSTRPIKDAINWDIPFTAEGIRFYAEFADKHGGDIAATASDALGMVISEPIGVVGAIAPWNFPLVMSSWKIAPAISAGNAVVIKPSELTPFSLLKLAELAVKAGIPAGVVNVVTGLGHTTGDALVRHPGIGKVTFTGSTQTGAAIMSACALTGPKPVTLELGGKSPQIVFADIENIDKVANTVARAFTGNAGQVCVAGTRLLVHEKIADQFIQKLVEHCNSIAAGPTWSSSTSFSPIINSTQAQKIDLTVQRTLAAGDAELLIGGEFIGDPAKGAFYKPTILVNVTEKAEAVTHEIFGPVITVQRFSNEEQAFELANSSVYGLAAGVFTSNINCAMRAVKKIKAGTVWINRYGRSNDFIIPTGGYKQSGIGKDLGRQAYLSNLHQKSVLIGIDDAD